MTRFNLSTFFRVRLVTHVGWGFHASVQRFKLQTIQTP